MLRLTFQKLRAVRRGLRRLGKAVVHRLGLATRGQVSELQQALWTRTDELAELKTRFQALAQTVQRLDVPNENTIRLVALEQGFGREQATRIAELDVLNNSLHALAGAVQHYAGKEVTVAKLIAQVKDETSVRFDALSAHLAAIEATLASRFGRLETRASRKLTETASQRIIVVEERVGHAERLGTEQALALGQLADQARSATDALKALRDGPLHELHERLAQTVNWLADEPWRVSPVPADAPLVSVVMAARDRADCIGAAIESVQRQSYANWELLVIDDGSTDDTAARVDAIAAADVRVRCLREPARGVAAARNRGLEAAAGPIIAYLDSDNVMAQDYLRAIVAAFAAHPETVAVYAAQVVQPGAATAPLWVRYQRFDRTALERGNYIDLNVFAHRRRLVDSAGGFDEALTRLVDYDLILRYTERQPPLALAELGGTYNDEPRLDRISIREELGLNYHRLHRRLERPLRPGLRVLYSVWHWPQVTESYVRWEAEYMRRRGVEVLVCPEINLPSPAGTRATCPPRTYPWSGRSNNFGRI